MVTRDRIQGETLQLLIVPAKPGAASAHTVMKGPSGAAVTTAGVATMTVIGFPWAIGSGGWFLGDYGPTPPMTTMFLVTVDTADFVAGLWGVEVWVVDTEGNKTVLTTANFTIKAALSNSGASDLRSTAQKAVEAIETYLANPTNIAAGSYTINNRSLSRHTPTELLHLLRYWKQQLRNENLRASGRRGQIGRRIEVVI